MSVDCVAAMTTMQIMTSLQDAMLWLPAQWCLATAGRIYQTVLMLRALPVPAKTIHTDSHGPRNSAASYRGMSSMLAIPVYVDFEVNVVVYVFPMFLPCKQQDLMTQMLVSFPTTLPIAPEQT